MSFNKGESFRPSGSPTPTTGGAIVFSRLEPESCVHASTSGGLIGMCGANLKQITST